MHWYDQIKKVYKKEPIQCNAVVRLENCSVRRSSISSHLSSENHFCNLKKTKPIICRLECHIANPLRNLLVLLARRKQSDFSLIEHRLKKPGKFSSEYSFIRHDDSRSTLKLVRLHTHHSSSY